MEQLRSVVKHRLDPAGKSFASGNEAQRLFYTAFENRFGEHTISEASLEDDIYNRQDFVICVNKDGVLHSATVDVKSYKYINRQDDNPSNSCTWVEFMSKNQKGWLYGKEDYVAFLSPRKDKFLVVKKEDLRELAERKCLGNSYVERAEDALYNLYIRKEKRDNGVVKIDIISLIKYKDTVDNCRFWILDTETKGKQV